MSNDYKTNKRIAWDKRGPRSDDVTTEAEIFRVLIGVYLISKDQWIVYHSRARPE